VIDQYIAHHGKRLYGLCITLCADSFDPDDLYQETWLKVCKKLHLYKPEMKFEYWLTQICVNTWRDQLRHKKFSPFVDLFSSTEEKDSLMENVRHRKQMITVTCIALLTTSLKNSEPLLFFTTFRIWI